MKKVHSFLIMKFNSDRLKNTNYNLEITLEDAKKNLEVIRIAESEMIRKLRGITNNNKLFIPEVVNIVFTHNTHYKSIINKSLIINNKKYVRFISSAGQARKSTVTFIQEEYLQPMLEFMECGRNLDYELNENKYNAYISLASSSTLRVREPNFVVIPDLEVEREIVVDFVSEPECNLCDPTITEKKIKLPINIFDGEGLVSPSMAKLWAEDIQANYLPSAFIIRAAWIKGLCAVFDFQEFAKKNDIVYIKDIYGEKHLVRDIDIILTRSQFKMAEGYKNLDEYKSKTREQGFHWGVSRVSPKKDRNHTTLTYQYLQILDLDSNEIAEVCKDTLDWLKDITKNDYIKTLLFLTGDIFYDGFDHEKFNSLEPFVKSLFVMPEMLHDGYVQRRILSMINKKIREAYVGVLNTHGNYQFMIIDPYALVQHAFGLKVTGLLDYDKFYSAYWNKKNINTVSSLRSPLTWKIENKCLNLVSNEKINYWYKYIYSGIIYNVYDNSLLEQAGADLDGDLCMTTSNTQVIANALGGNPVVYERKTANKRKINYRDLWKSDIRTFGSKIGFITNLGTTYFSMLDSLPEEDKKIIINRIKFLNAGQNMQIDRGKGIRVMEIPLHWTKWMNPKIFTGEEQDRVVRNNRLLAQKRPYFMRYIYRDYNRKYIFEREGYDDSSHDMFAKGLTELSDSSDKEEKEYLEKYYRKSKFIQKTGTMNSICTYMEDNVSKIKVDIKEKSKDVFHKYYSGVYTPKKSDLFYLDKIFEEYKSTKKMVHFKDEFESLDNFLEYLKAKILSELFLSDREFGNLAVYYGYEYKKQAVSFVWSIFGGFIWKNILQNSSNEIQIPVGYEYGEIDYLWTTYTKENLYITK